MFLRVRNFVGGILVAFIVTTTIVLINPAAQAEAAQRDTEQIASWTMHTVTTGELIPSCAGGIVKTDCDRGWIPVTFEDGKRTSVEWSLNKTYGATMPLWVNQAGAHTVTKPVADAGGLWLAMLCLILSIVAATIYCVALVALQAIADELHDRRTATPKLQT